VVIAQDSGNRDNESHLALNLAWLEAEHGDTASAFDHLHAPASPKGTRKLKTSYRRWRGDTTDITEQQ
jgi:hypothetical protein